MRFRVSRAVSDDGTTTWVYGDRNQYNKLATLLTHAGLILFLVAGAITVAGGFETMVFVGEGQTAPVQRVGTPGNLMVKVVDFSAPRRANGSFADFATDLAVYRDGAEVARQTIRVNDPLRLDGFTFYQNTFGPAIDLDIRDAAGDLAWSGPGHPRRAVPGPAAGLPHDPGHGRRPGRRPRRRRRRLAAGGAPGRRARRGGRESGRDRVPRDGARRRGDRPRDQRRPRDRRGAGVGSWTGIVVKNDPGQPLIWIAFGLLIIGLVLTFYFPRRRAWARIEDGRVALAFIADRYVDRDREFGQLRERVQSAFLADPVTKMDNRRA